MFGLIIRGLAAALAAIGIDRIFNKPAPAVNTSDSTGNFDFMKSIKVIAIITAGGLAAHLLLKTFRVKLFGKLIR